LRLNGAQQIEGIARPIGIACNDDVRLKLGRFAGTVWFNDALKLPSGDETLKRFALTLIWFDD
jgi:hypothetical protein